MFVSHQFFDNTVSWSNSYVTVFKTLQWAKTEMICSIKNCISHCEKDTMKKMIELIISHPWWHNAIEETVDDFTISYTEFGYEIVGSDYDVYFFRILDVNNDETSSCF